MGNAPITWDEQFSVFIRWNAYYNDDTPVEAVLRWDVVRPTSKEADERFALLGPGKSISRIFHLSGGIKCFGSGDIHTLARHHARYTGSEYLISYTFNGHKNRYAHIKVSYSIGRSDRGGFAAWFGRDFNDYQFYHGNASSNSLQVGLEMWERQGGGKRD
jgi:hypothetical protein